MGDAPAPLLVIVAGAPGAGKTTLATRLATDLCLPLITKDRIKEILGDALGAADVAQSQVLGEATYALLYAIAGWLLDARTGAVLESNFWRGTSERALLPLVNRSAAVLVHCHAPATVILDRYLARAARGERHPVHFDHDVLPRLRADIAEGRYEPLELGVPCVSVETADRYDPPYEDILATLRAVIDSVTHA